MILYTRIINLILSICMIVVSLLAMLTTQSATTGVLACYLIIFACLLCCFETHLKQVSKLIALNFGFMYSARARSVFMLFVGKWSGNILCRLHSDLIAFLLRNRFSPLYQVRFYFRSACSARSWACAWW
jgi:hypothetical protein